MEILKKMNNNLNTKIKIPEVQLQDKKAFL